MPEEITNPGLAIQKELDSRGWTQTDLAQILGVHQSVVSALVTGKRPISLEIARDLAAVFRTELEYWLKLETDFRLFTAGPVDSGIARRARLFEAAPVKEMIKRRWIQATTEVELLEKQVLAFYGVSSFDEISAPPHAARKSSSYTETSSPERAWMQRARVVARMVSARKFSDERLDQAVSEFKNVMLHPESVRHIPKMLAEAGVRFVVVEPLPKTRIDGVCLWLDKSSPIVALSLRIDQIDSVWFTLLHEVRHVKNRDGLVGPAVVDSDLIGENAVPSDQKPEAEQDADRFAANTLVSAADLENFIARVKPLYSRTKIQGFASRMGVHPGVVVGQLQHRGEIHWGHGREFQAKVREILIQSALTDGWGQALPLAS
jgi:HTH-type transcriptional regulator/antitoxin HigA